MAKSAQQKLDDALEKARQADEELGYAALWYEGIGDRFGRLAAAAKRQVTAWHAVGRIRKHVKEGPASARARETLGVAVPKAAKRS